MKSLKWMVSLMLVFILAALTACGNSNNSGSSTGGSEASSSPEPSAADPLRAYEGTTLNVLIKTGYESEAITVFQDDFTEATGIELNIEVVDEPTLRKKFTLDSVSSTGAYDVVATQFWYMPEYLQGGFLEPLDGYIANNPTEWLSVSDIPEGQLATYRDDAGQLYSLPVSSSGGVLMYRKDLFEQYGIPVPKTTEDVMNAAKALKEQLPSDIVPFVGRADSSSGSFGSSAGWAWGYGASMFDAEGNIAVTSEAMKQAMTDWVTLMKDYGPADASAMGWDSMSEMFRQGKAAMNFDMSGFPAVYMDPASSQVADQVGVTIVNGPAGNPIQWVYSEGLGISSASSNKDAAWLFLQWRTSLEVAIKEVQEGLRTDFPMSSIYETDEYKTSTEGNEFAPFIPEVMNAADFSYWPNIAEFDQAGQAFQAVVSLAIAGSMTIDEAMQTAQTEIEKIVNR